MLCFMLGISAVYAACMGTNLALDPAVRSDNPWIGIFLLNTCVVPLACGWAVAELVRAGTRRRVFTPGACSRGRQIMLGGIAGVVGIFFTFFTMFMLPDLIDRFTGRYFWLTSDLKIGSVCTGLAVGLVLLCSRRLRAGVCVRCRYDLSGLTPAAGERCPECGTPVLSA